MVYEIVGRCVIHSAPAAAAGQFAACRAANDKLTSCSACLAEHWTWCGNICKRSRHTAESQVLGAFDDLMSATLAQVADVVNRDPRSHNFRN